MLLKIVRILRRYAPRVNQGEQVIGKSCFHNPVKHPRWSSFTEIVNDLKRLTLFAKKALPQMFDWIPKGGAGGVGGV